MLLICGKYRCTVWYLKQEDMGTATTKHPINPVFGVAKRSSLLTPEDLLWSMASVRQCAFTDSLVQFREPGALCRRPAENRSGRQTSQRC